MKNVHVFVPVFLDAVTKLIFEIKRIFSSEKWCKYSLLFFIFLKMPNIWVGRTTVKGEKKRMALLLSFRTIIIIAGKSHIHGHKENRLELFKSRRHFGEIKQPKTLNQPQSKNFTFLKRPKKKMLLHKRAKRANHADQSKSKCMSRPLSNSISGQNSHFLRQNVFLQSTIYPTKIKKTIHWNKQHFGTR